MQHLHFQFQLAFQHNKTLQTSKQILRIVDRFTECYLATKSGKSPMPSAHHQVSSAAQDVRAAKWNQRSKQEWNWVIFMYYSTSTFCWVVSVPSLHRWTVSVSGHSCHGHGRRSTAGLIGFILPAWSVTLIFYAFFHCMGRSLSDIELC